MGSFSVWMNDYQGSEMTAWFTNAYAASFADTNIRYRLLGQHYSSGGYSFSPPSGQYPNLMLVGHIHSFSTIQLAPYPILSSGPAHVYGAVALFTFAREGTNWVCAGATNHPAGTRAYAVGDWGLPNLSAVFAYSNTGTRTDNSAAITNPIAFSFWDGRVRFLMRSAGAGYTVTGGEELADYEYNGTNRAVVVRVNIAAGTQTVVSVAAAPDGDGDGLADAVDEDDDNDGLPDTWELEYSLNPTNAADAGDDGDADTFDNTQEYIARTDPTNGLSRFEILAISNVPGICIYLESFTDRLYSVLYRDSLLTTNAWSVLTNDVPGSDSVLQVSDSDSVTQRYYRTVVGMP